MSEGILFIRLDDIHLPEDYIRPLDEAASEVVTFDRHDGWRCVMNFGTEPVPLPAGRVLLASGPLADRDLPGETTVWAWAMAVMEAVAMRAARTTRFIENIPTIDLLWIERGGP